MTALAGKRRLIAEALAVVATVFAALRYRTVATRMRALVNFPFSHDMLLASVPYHNREAAATVNGLRSMGSFQVRLAH
jgi:hypothetical protein